MSYSTDPLSYGIDTQHGVAHVVLAGALTFASLCELDERMRSDPRFRPQLASYIDCRVLTEIPSTGEIRKLALDRLLERAQYPLGRIAIDTIRRGDSVTTVGLLGFTTYPYAYDLLDIARSAAVVDSLRHLVDLLVVTFHGGSEGIRALHVPETAESLGREPRGDLRRWARAVIDAGADAVIGHGPHVLRGIEFYRERPIAYSLGNFVTYRGFNLDGPLGVTGVLQLEFAPDRRLRSARLVPMIQRPREGPAPDPDRSALDLVRRLSSEDFGAAAARVTEDGAVFPPP